MSFADLHHSHPARGLRQILAMNSDRLWFALAVLLSLLASFEIAALMMPALPTGIDGGFGL